MQFNTYVTCRVSYDEESDSGDIYLEEIGPGDVARSFQIPLSGPGPIVVDFNSDDRLLGIEINEFSKIVPRKFLEQVLRGRKP